ncbi:MAG: hypothetical protein GC157_11330 [Frankiales bacterium]|nr:hypothetical protein [Frankiales bacterium]
MGMQKSASRARVPAGVLVAAVCACGLAACAQETTPLPDATVGYCVGVDEQHPADARVTVSFRRGDQTLGFVGNVVTGTSAVGVTPGPVEVYVDDVRVGTLTVSAGSRAYATSGTGCPSTMRP